ncbi:kinase-like domain-containing protein [Crassisporium funariophilum]|nr:kinase-like domain-containing protein [Crassisporium funariophilum]
MDDSINYGMEYDEDACEDSQESEHQQTQSTQQASQPPNVSVDAHLWGYLQPCSASLTRIDFWKIHPRYTIGRNTELNQVILPGFKVSNQHCVIVWDGAESSSSTAVVHDLSSNGTFINGERIGKGATRIVREGNEIAFGTSVPQPQNGGLEDYRFIYRHTAGGPPTEGLYAFYDLSTELGKGSFATVRKAISRSSGQWYAVKMIQESKNVRQNGENGRTSRNNTFAREISIMEKLKHPNICELVEVFFQENNDINLVLELVEGGDLLEYILKNNGLCEVDAKHITYQMCDALAYIHSLGVAHRDLKPENVLLTRDNPPIVKVADFGLAKVVDSLTMLRTMCGTPSYLAPEVVKQENRDGYDNLVDSWSVGVIVFSMLTNSGPFIEDENQRDICIRILGRTVDWNTLLNCGVGDEAISFIRNLLRDDPRQRMSLTKARGHPWLLSYTPVYNLPLPGVPKPSSNPPATTAQGQSAGAGHGSPFISDIAQAGSSRGARTAPLQRRSQVLSQAAESGSSLPEPSWEMIAYAASQEQEKAATNPANKGPNKRVHAQLTPLPEEAVDDTKMDSLDIADISPPGLRRSRDLPDEDNSVPRRSTRRNKVARHG